MRSCAWIGNSKLRITRVSMFLTILSMSDCLGMCLRIIDNGVSIGTNAWGVCVNSISGGNHHHGDHWSLFFPPSIEPTPSTVLDCFVNVFVDPRPPESIRDQAFHSLLSLVASIMVTAIYSSSPVCSRHNKTFYLFNGGSNGVNRFYFKIRVFF